MKPAASLTSKITLLALLTLVLLTSFLLIFAAVQFRISPTNFIVAPALNHITSVAGDVAQDLAETPAGSRTELLSRLSKDYGVEFYLVDVDGHSLTGVPVNLPPAIRIEISQKIQQLREDAARRAGGSGRVGPGGLVIGPWRVDAIFRKKTDNPSEYWVGVPMRVRSADNPEPSTGFLVLMSDSLIGNQFFFDPETLGCADPGIDGSLRHYLVALDSQFDPRDFANERRHQPDRGGTVRNPIEG